MCGYRLCFCLALAAAFAQFSSSIEGSVTDSTGAIVPGAKVVLTGMSTGVTSDTKSNSAGLYKFPSLGPGAYKVTVTMQGFAPVTEENIELTAMQTQGCFHQAAALLGDDERGGGGRTTAVETDEATISTVTDQKSIEELPIQGRNLFSLCQPDARALPARG